MTVLAVRISASSNAPEILVEQWTASPGSRSIDKGLASSRFGIVVLSRAFMNKPWPEREIRGLVTLEIEGNCVVLPIWHGVTRAEVSGFSPPLADQVAVRTSDAEAIDIAIQILKVVRPELYADHPRSELEKLANGEAIAELEEDLAAVRSQLAEFQYPYCKSQLISAVYAPADPEDKHLDVVRTFECGYQEFGGTKLRVCWGDPDFPSFDEYELVYSEQETAPLFALDMRGDTSDRCCSTLFVAAGLW